MTCSHRGCEEPTKARGMCSSHYNRWYYQQDPERHRQRSKRWAEENPDKVAARDRRRTAEQKRKAARRYYWKNPLRGRVAAANDKARRLGLPGRLTVEGVAARLAYYGDRCWVCGAPDADTLDHVRPFGAGGPNVHSNIRPACASCNFARTWEGRRPA